MAATWETLYQTRLVFAGSGFSYLLGRVVSRLETGSPLVFCVVLWSKWTRVLQSVWLSMVGEQCASTDEGVEEKLGERLKD